MYLKASEIKRDSTEKKFSESMVALQWLGFFTWKCCLNFNKKNSGLSPGALSKKIPVKKVTGCKTNTTRRGDKSWVTCKKDRYRLFYY